MIAPMRKVYVAASQADRDRLLQALRDLGVVHLVAVDPRRAVDERLAAAIERFDRAIQILDGVKPGPVRPDVTADQAATEAANMPRESAELTARLGALHRQHDQQAIWGDLRLDQLAALRQTGLRVAFAAVSNDRLDQVRGECVQPLHALAGRRTLVAIVDRAETLLPDGAEEIPLPAKDRPAIRVEAAEIDAALKRLADRLGELAHLRDELVAARAERVQQADYAAAHRGGLSGDDLFAIQGWAPADAAPGLSTGLAEAGLHAAVQVSEPSADDAPPTLIRYPRWTRPIKGLFNILGIVPGYRELDLSAAFMIALPIFVAMLISDGGYGLLFLLLPALFYRKVSAKMGPQMAQLLIVMGVLAVIWGAMTVSFFGLTPTDLQRAGGLWGNIGEALGRVQLIRVDTTESSRRLLMRISFILGVIHLSLAQLRRAAALFPGLGALGKVGWAVFLWGMFGVVKLFVLKDPFVGTVYPYLLMAGGAMAILFGAPHRNPLAMVALGLANFPLSAMSTFSDIMSYVRLMAVGLASSVLALSFNKLALATGIWPAAVVILILGHALNLGLCLIALFAHGVRLNVLEFSNNVGMEWTGHAYRPFAKATAQENQA